MEFAMMFAEISSVCETITSGSASRIAYMISLAITFIQILVPILLILWGMLDLGKAVISQKEDDIKKGQNTFIKRLIAAAIVFFIVTIVKIVISLVDGGDSEIITCIDKIINCASPTKCG